MVYVDASRNQGTSSGKVSSADKLSVACYLQVDGLFVELSMNAVRPVDVDNPDVCQQLSTPRQQVFHKRESYPAKPEIVC